MHANARVRVAPPAALEVGATAPWEAVRERLRFVAGAPFEAAAQFAVASPFVPRLAALRDWAAPSLAPGRPVAAAAIDLMDRLHREFAYRSASTTLDTPLADVLARREGVCQDFAHLLIGALRMHGLAARYLSGYLLTTPVRAAANDAPMLGGYASHAWLAVWCPLGAASAMLRSGLEKMLLANGYTRGSLKAEIDDAAKDHVITEARMQRAHDEIRVLVNDIMHDEWRVVTQDEYELAHHYVQRIAEDFYDDRPSVEKILQSVWKLQPPVSPMQKPS